MNLTFYLAIDRLDLGKGVAIEFIGPITVAALTTRTKRNAAALAFATLGVIVLSGIEVDNEPLGLVFILDRKSTRLNSSHSSVSRMPSSA